MGDQNEKSSTKKPNVIPDLIQPEIKDSRDETLTDLQTHARQKISNSNISMVASGKSIDVETQKYLNQYFQGSIDRFDKDKDGKISADEAKDFKSKMLEKTETIINDVKGADQANKETQEAAGNLETMGTTEVNEKISEITDISKNENLGLEDIDGEFKKMQKQNTAFQQSIKNQVTQINEFGKKFAGFQEKQKGSGYIASTIKGIFSDSEANEEKALQELLASTKTAAKEVLTDLTAKKEILDKNGETIKAAIAKERVRIIKERDEKLKEISEAQSEQKEAIDEKKKKYKEIEDQQEKLENRKKGIEAKQSNIANIQTTWAEIKGAEQWENRKKDMTESTLDAQTELQAMDILLNEPSITPEAKEKVEIERNKIAERLQRGELGIKLADERIETGKKVDRQLSNDEMAAAKDLSSVSNYLNNQLMPSKESLADNIANLEKLKIQYATEATQVTEHYNKRVDDVDKVSEGVNDYVFASATSRNKSIETLKSSTESLNSLTVERKSAWHMLNPAVYLEAVGEGFMLIAKGIDESTNDLLRTIRGEFNESTSTGGKIGYGLLYGLTQVAGAFAGFVSGGCELVGGVFHMAAHPLDSLNGLGTLLGMNVKEGKFLDGETFAAAWGGMLGAIIGYEQFAGEKENYGGAVGKFAFNVMSVLVGGGAGAGAKAAEAANIARVAEINVALAKAGANVGKFEGVAAKLAALKKVDAVLAKTTQSTARSAYIKTFAKTAIYESLPQFTKNAAKASRNATGFGGKTWAVAKSLAQPSMDGLAALKRGVKAAPSVIPNIPSILMSVPRAGMGMIARVARKIPDGWKAYRGEGIANSKRASKMAEAGKIISAESGQYAKARIKITEIIEKDPELFQLAKEGEFGLAAAEGKARLKLMREDPALAASYSKVEKASKTLTEYSEKMAESSLKTLDNVKNNPKLKGEVAEYENLKTKATEAKSTYDQVQNTTAAPKTKPHVVTDPLSVESLDQYLDRATNQHGWNAEQKAHLREELLSSDNLKNTAPGNVFNRKMQDIIDPYISSSNKFPVKPDVPKISTAEAKTQLKQAEKNLKDFEDDPARMKFVKQHEEAVAAENNLRATIEQQQNLFQEYTGSRNPELVSLEAEISEAAARHGDTPGGRPAIKDTPEVIRANYDTFVDSIKSGDAKKIERARAEFGPHESNSIISKKLDAAEQIIKESSIEKQARAEAIKKYSEACKNKTNPYAGDLSEMRKQYLDALKKGDLEVLEHIKTQKINQPHLEALKGIELEYLASPNSFFDTYMKHQDGLYNMYKEYNQAWAEGNTAKLGEIRQAHPDLSKALDQLDLRHTVLDKNTAIAHDIAAARIKVDLITDKGFPSTTKATDAAKVLSRRYNNDKLQLGISSTSKEITTLELLDDAGKPAMYKVRLEANGEVLLIAEDLKPVIKPKLAPEVGKTKITAPSTTTLDLDLAKTKVKVYEQDLVKLEKELKTARNKQNAVTNLEEQIKIAKTNLEEARRQVSLTNASAGTPSANPRSLTSGDEVVKTENIRKAGADLINEWALKIEEMAKNPPPINPNTNKPYTKWFTAKLQVEAVYKTFHEIATNRVMTKAELEGILNKTHQKLEKFRNPKIDFDGQMYFKGTDNLPYHSDLRKAYLNPPLDKYGDFIEKFMEVAKEKNLKYIEAKTNLLEMHLDANSKLIQTNNSFCMYFRNDAEFSKFIEVAKETELRSGIQLLESAKGQHGQALNGKINYGVDLAKGSTRNFDGWKGYIIHSMTNIKIKGGGTAEMIAEAEKVLMKNRGVSSMEDFLVLKENIANPAASNIPANIKLMETDLVKLEGQLASAKTNIKSNNITGLEKDIADLRNKLNDANLEVSKLGTEAPATAPATPPAEFTEYQNLKQRKATADSNFAPIFNAEELPKIDRNKVKTAITDLSLEQLDTTLKNIGRPEKLTTAELLEIRAELIKSKKLEGLKSTGIVDRQDFEKIIRDAIRNKANSVKATERAAAAMAESKAAKDALLTFEKDSTKLKAATDYEKQIASTPYRAPEPIKKLTPDEIKTLESDLTKLETDLTTAKALPEYQTAAEKVAELEAKITTTRDQLTQARKTPPGVRIALPGQPIPVSTISKLESELTVLEKELNTAKATPEYQSAAKLEAEIALKQTELTAGRPVKAATPEKQPTPIRLREANKAVEAAKLDLLGEQKALRTLKENLHVTEETWLKAKESGKYNEASINNLRNKVEQARDAVLTSENKIASLEEALSSSRSEYRNALLLRGGEKVLEKITSPLRAKWVENLKNKLLALPGAPKNAVLGLAGLLGELPRLIVLKAFQQLNQGFGKAFRNYVSQLMNAETNPEVLRRLLAPITAEQLIIMTQLTKGRMPDAKEMANFSDLPMPQKLAVLEEGWNKLEKGGAGSSADFFNNNEQASIKASEATLEKAIEKFEDQDDLTPELVIHNLEHYLGPNSNTIGKTYEMAYEGITVTIAKDGKRTYSGVEDWLVDQPKRKLVRNSFTDTIDEHDELTLNDLKKSNNDKPIDSVEDYKKNLSEQITGKLTKQLEKQEFSKNITNIKSRELTSEGQPTFKANFNGKDKISLEINDEWANASFNKIKERKAPPAPKPSGQPRPTGQQKPATELNTDAADDNSFPDDTYI